MAKIDLFSNRNKKDNQNSDDIFQYNILPVEFRNQVVLIMDEIYNSVNSSRYNRDDLEGLFEIINKTLCKEFGKLSLVKKGNMYSLQSERNDLKNFIINEENIEFVLSAIELTFRVFNNLSENQFSSSISTINDATEELNIRFFDHNLGFQYESGQIIKLDSKLLHEEVTKPTLLVLSAEIYKGANDEFLSAYEHYAKGNYKECLVDCLKSFESTMKIICSKHGWEYDQDKDSASKLLEICFQHKLIPDYLQSQFGTLRANLESGIPTVRNREAGHGQGTTPKLPPQYLVSYLLHLTATSILLLTDAEKEL